MRAQSTFLDFGTGFFLFMIVLLIGGSFLTGRSDTSQAPDVLRMSNELLTEGIPTDWNASTVIMAGILSNGTVDAAKWDTLRGMSPEELRSIFFLSGEIYIRLSRYPSGQQYTVLPPISTTTVTYEGIPSQDHTSISTISRITNYDGRLTVLEVVTWR